MIRHSIHEAYRLIGRSKKAAALYLGASLVSSWLYVFMCGQLGLAGAYAGAEAVKAEPVKGLITYLPGIAVLAWFAAGTTGRFVMDALKGEAEGLPRYANGWFFRKAGWDLIFMFLMWVPMWFMALKFPGVIVVSLAWMVAALWLGVRVSLWLNISITEDLGLPEALKRSYALTRGRVWTLVMIGVVPMIAAKLLSWLVTAAFSAQGGAAYYTKAFFEGAAGVVVIGAFAAAYLKIKEAGPADR